MPQLLINTQQAPSRLVLFNTIAPPVGPTPSIHVGPFKVTLRFPCRLTAQQVNFPRRFSPRFPSLINYFGLTSLLTLG